MRHSAVVTLASVLLAGSLSAGCASDPEPKFADPTSSEPTFSSSGSPTESASGPTTEPATEEPSGPVEPEYPDEANGKDRAAAEAFVRFYFDVIDYADASADTEPMRRYAPTCLPCQNIADFADDLESEGTRVVGIDRTVDVTGFSMVRHEGRLVASVDLKYSTNKHKVVTKRGKVTRKVPNTTMVFVIATRPVGSGRWRIDDLGSSE